MISTPRLLLRPFTLADAPKLFALSQEADLRRWIPDQVYRDEAEAEQVLRALIAHTDRGPDPATRPYVLALEHRPTGDLIGHIGLSPARSSVEVGYAIEQRLHGQGLATEAVRAASDWALTALALPELLGIVDANNTSSCRVLEKAGFTRITEEQRGDRTLLVYRRVASAHAQPNGL
jgi:ribosomal-protein-alanine N-acetyltransferase